MTQNRNINGLTNDSFKIQLHLGLNFSDSSLGDKVFNNCNTDVNGQFIAGNGLFNESILDLNADGLIDQKILFVQILIIMIWHFEKSV